MEKNEYTEYFEIIEVENEQIEMTVQVPKDPEMPVHIIEKQGARTMIRTLEEWSAINDFVMRALSNAGYRVEND